jgi:hypothetical protein
VSHLTEADDTHHAVVLPTFTAPSRQHEYLKAENQILRRLLGKRPYLDEPDKRLLVKLGQAIGKGIKDLLSIVSYPTYRHWVGLYDPAGAGAKPAGARGKGDRPRISGETRELVFGWTCESRRRRVILLGAHPLARTISIV